MDPRPSDLLSGKVRWMVLNGALDTDQLIEFMKRLVKDAGRKVFLILDNLRVHHARLVKAWLAKHRDEIEVFYLPSYSPELNPDEMLNADLKQAVTTKAPARTKGQLLKVTTSHMRKLQKSPERVKSYFEHAPVKSARIVHKQKMSTSHRHAFAAGREFFAGYVVRSCMS